MGAGCCKPLDEPPEDAEEGSFTNRVKTFRRPKWRSDEPIDAEKLQAMQDEYWDTEPAYGGDRVIWDALRAACAADIDTARVILDSAGIIVASEDMAVCYDEKGRKYELPKYVLSPPTNLERGSSSGKERSTGSRRMVLELPAAAAATHS